MKESTSAQAEFSQPHAFAEQQIVNIVLHAKLYKRAAPLVVENHVELDPSPPKPQVDLVAPVPLVAEEKEVAVIEAKPSRPEVE